MRRFSQRNSLVTLSDINITPLLDLAFVLLIIFVITTPLLEQGIGLRLPEGGRAEASLTRENIHILDIDAQGRYFLDRRQMSLEDLERNLIAIHNADKEMVVHVRADRDSLVKNLYPVIDRCTKNNITRFNLRTEPPRR